MFLAGASGVIGSRLIPLLRLAGHEGAGLTRTEGKAAWLAELGAGPVVCDVFDKDALQRMGMLTPDGHNTFGAMHGTIMVFFGIVSAAFAF